MALMIGDTANITLLTGLPGSGKTLRMVKFVKEAHERGELIYVSNFNGLKIPHTPFPNPRAWRDLPAGSVLVVDEAQEFFRSRRGGDPPEYLTAMERIRHAGVRLVLATQQPDYLDAHLRGLVGLHEHLLRENGKQVAKIWRHNEVMDNVRSERARSRYDSEVWEYEPGLFELYTSAQVHTMKKRMSAKFKKGLKFAAVALVLLGILAWRVPDLLDMKSAKAGAGEGTTAAQAAAVPRSRAAAPVSAEEWAELRAPRHEAFPDSAPLYDGRTPQDYPRAYCMASGEAPNESCTCMSQQGTRIAMPREKCIFQAYHGGAFDPYKAPPDLRNVEPVPLAGEGGLPPSDTGTERAASRSPVAVGIGDPNLLQQPYGGMR